MNEKQNVLKESDKAFIDVRKAFRLLFLFQSRVRNVCHDICEQLNYWHYYSESPIGHGYDPEEVFVPTLRRLYLPAKRPNNAIKDDHMLELVSVADDSFESFVKEESAETPEDANSFLLFRIYINKSNEERNWLGISRKYHNEFTDFDKHIISSDKTAVSYCQRFDFCELCDSSAISKVLKNFKSNVQEILKLAL